MTTDHINELIQLLDSMSSTIGNSKQTYINELFHFISEYFITKE